MAHPRWNSGAGLGDMIASEMQLDPNSKQELLEMLNPADRLEKLLAYLK
jgi:ATP-dependent Lon protease